MSLSRRMLLATPAALFTQPACAGGLPAAWQVADKTGNNGADAAGDIAMAWPAPGVPIVICVYTQGGAPTAAQLETVFGDIGRAVSQALA